MKVKKYEIVGIRKIVSTEKQKSYTLLNCVSCSDEKSDFMVGKEVVKLFGSGTEYIGDVVRAVTVSGKTMRVDDEE